MCLQKQEGWFGGCCFLGLLPSMLVSGIAVQPCPLRFTSPGGWAVFIGNHGGEPTTHAHLSFDCQKLHKNCNWKRVTSHVSLAAGRVEPANKGDVRRDDGFCWLDSLLLSKADVILNKKQTPAPPGQRGWIIAWVQRNLGGKRKSTSSWRNQDERSASSLHV